jgi:hypothetical protein
VKPSYSRREATQPAVEEKRDLHRMDQCIIAMFHFHGIGSWIGPLYSARFFCTILSLAHVKRYVPQDRPPALAKTGLDGKRSSATRFAGVAASHVYGGGRPR